jgi:hypothetical protein
MAVNKIIYCHNSILGKIQIPRPMQSCEMVFVELNHLNLSLNLSRTYFCGNCITFAFNAKKNQHTE